MMRHTALTWVGEWVRQVYIPTFELTEYHANYAVITEQPNVALSNFLELVRITLPTRVNWCGSNASTTYFKVLKY